MNVVFRMVSKDLHEMIYRVHRIYNLGVFFGKKLTTIFGCCCSRSCCWFTMIWCFAYAIWQPNLPLINFTIRLSWFHITDTEKMCIQTNILVSDDSDKGQAEISSGETNTVCVNNHHSHKQQMCQRWWSYSDGSAVCLSIALEFCSVWHTSSNLRARLKVKEN